ncbi:MAG: hypothetical protein ACPGLV_11220 [Bacteroidia bacterium]
MKKMTSIVYFNVICTSFIFGALSCQKENNKVQETKYYIEGAISHGSFLYINIYKMAPLRYDTNYTNGYRFYINQGLKIEQPVYLKLSDDKGNSTDTTLLTLIDLGNIWKNSLVGEANTWYNLNVTIGSETLSTDFYLPDSFSLDSFNLNTVPDNESLQIGIKYPESYISNDTMCFLPVDYSYSGFEVFYDFCKIENAVFTNDLINGKYLDWYLYEDCNQKAFFDNFDHQERVRHLSFFFKPYSGRPIRAVDSKTYRYIKQLNHQVEKGINGISYPTTLPSQFDSEVFYGGIIPFAEKIAVFEKP